MKIKIIFLVLLFFLPLLNQASNLNEEKTKYLEAIKFYQGSDYENFKKIKKDLINYPLYAELEYKELFLDKNINENDVIKFIKKYEKSYLSEKAYVNLVYHLSKSLKFEQLIFIYNKKKNIIDLDCLYIRAKIKKKYDIDFNKEIKPIWLSGKPQPITCEFVFNWSYKNKKLVDELVWQRIEMALNLNNYSLAGQLINFLSNKNKIWAEELLKVYKYPEEYILSDIFLEKNNYIETIFSYGLNKIAEKSYISAKDYLSKVKYKYGLSNNFYNKKLLEIYIIGMKSNQKYIFSNNEIFLLKDFNLYFQKSDNFYDKATKNNLDFLLAFANYSIFNSDWNRLLDAINSMQNQVAQEEKWIYWKGKALYKLKNNEYKLILDSLSKSRSYYGFLASIILERPISINNFELYASENDLKKLEATYEVKRIKELYLVGNENDAIKEVKYFFQNSNLNNLNNLNILFKKWGWSKGAIIGYSSTKYYDDLKIRFPVSYEKYFDRYSDSNIQKSLLLGIARKESIFNAFEKSPKGALGIMQILPKTSDEVLKKLKIEEKHENYLYDEEINIRIGSYYFFNSLFSRKKSYVEAIASYNAGPGNVSKWRKENNSSEDSWVESIPYYETRNYVKLVLEYCLIYDWILNNKNTIPVSQLINIDK